MATHSDIITQPSYIADMFNDGVCILKNKIPNEKIQLILLEIQKIRKIVSSKIAKMDRPLRTYSDIAERQLGRLDYRCGFTAEIFQQVAKPLINIIKTFSPTIDFNYYWGAIPSLGKSGPTDLHRDVYPILNTCKGTNLDAIDINLPPYYFTLFMPLVAITQQNGPTQFIKGSHRKQVMDEREEEIYAPLLSPGDVVIFDGRTLHRGQANQTQEERLIAYITFIANWYHDQTFTVNDFLFPELSV